MALVLQYDGCFHQTKIYCLAFHPSHISTRKRRLFFYKPPSRYEGALDPKIASFGQFKDFVAQKLDPAKQRKIAMFCTGGIRCEKASSLLLAQGFAEVYHLKGGILKYLEEVPEAESRWRGECFVFDERVALGHGLREKARQKAREDASHE